MQNSDCWFCRVKNCPHENMLNLVNIRSNFGHDELKMGNKIPYFYVDNFSHDQIKQMNYEL